MTKIKKRYMKNSRKNSGQMITMMGFIMVLSVVILASISSNLSNVGTSVSKIHSKALLPEFLTIRDKLALATNYYTNNVNPKTGEMPDIEESFYDACNIFYDISIKHGNHFSATFNEYTPAGNTPTGAVFYLSATISLNDGTTQISKDVVYVIVQKVV